MIGLNRRRMMGGEKLPYDAEIEYLESSGTQWIDTGIYPTNTTVAKLKFMNLESTGFVIFGMYDGENNSYRYFNYGGNSYFDTGEGVHKNRLIADNIKVYPNEIYEIEFMLRDYFAERRVTW